MLTVLHCSPNGSLGARALAKNLGIPRIKGDRKPFNHDCAIVWGVSRPPRFLRPPRKVFNHWGSIRNAADKAAAFDMLSRANVPVVQFTRDWQEARRWSAEGWTVIARDTLSGSGGAGIRIIRPGQFVAENETRTPGFTAFFPSTSEYRVHAFATGETLVAKKAKRNGVEPDDIPIRNHGDVYVFKYHDLKFPPEIKDLAVKAVEGLGLQFGAVDILWHSPSRTGRVLEVNTAPGLDHSVPLEWYTVQFKERISDE